jgi:hypothetical protein
MKAGAMMAGFCSSSRIAIVLQAAAAAAAAATAERGEYWPQYAVLLTHWVVNTALSYTLTNDTP